MGELKGTIVTVDTRDLGTRYVSIIRNNLMTEKGYSPYCGNLIPRREIGGCSCPRTKFNGSQFACAECGWTSSFESDFIKEYKDKWKI